MHCMDVHKTKVTRPRPRRYIFKTESFQKASRDRLETEMFKTETTSLPYTGKVSTGVAAYNRQVYQ